MAVCILILALVVTSTAATAIVGPFLPAHRNNHYFVGGFPQVTYTGRFGTPLNISCLSSGYGNHVHRRACKVNNPARCLFDGGRSGLGQAGRQFTISNLQVDDEGTYTCLASSIRPGAGYATTGVNFTIRGDTHAPSISARAEQSQDSQPVQVRYHERMTTVYTRNETGLTINCSTLPSTSDPGRGDARRRVDRFHVTSKEELHNYTCETHDDAHLVAVAVAQPPQIRIVSSETDAHTYIWTFKMLVYGSPNKDLQICNKRQCTPILDFNTRRTAKIRRLKFKWNPPQQLGCPGLLTGRIRGPWKANVTVRSFVGETTKEYTPSYQNVEEEDTIDGCNRLTTVNKQYIQLTKIFLDFVKHQHICAGQSTRQS